MEKLNEQDDRVCCTCHQTGKTFGRSSNKCKDCRKAYSILNKEKIKNQQSAYYQKNKDKIKEDVKLYSQENKEKIAERSAIYYQEHREEILGRTKEYGEEHKDEIKEYRKANHEKINERARAYYHKYRKTNPLKRIRVNVSSSIRIALKGNKNNCSIIKHLPYTIEELKIHIESQFEPWMTWENWGVYDLKSWNDNDSMTWKWQLDHIIPHSTFKYTSMDCQEFRDCWALSNLRPLNAKQNSIEGSTKIRH